MSNVTGEVAGPRVTGRREYWVDHVRAAGAVRRQGAVGRSRWGRRISWRWVPVAALTGGDRAVAGRRPSRWWSSMLGKDRPEVASLLGAAGAVVRRRGGGGLAGGVRRLGGGRVELPTYAFQRRRFWLPAGVGPADAASLGLGGSRACAVGGGGRAARVRRGGVDGPVVAGRRSRGWPITRSAGWCCSRVRGLWSW